MTPLHAAVVLALPFGIVQGACVNTDGWSSTSQGWDCNTYSAQPYMCSWGYYYEDLGFGSSEMCCVFGGGAPVPTPRPPPPPRHRRQPTPPPPPTPPPTPAPMPPPPPTPAPTPPPPPTPPPTPAPTPPPQPTPAPTSSSRMASRSALLGTGLYPRASAVQALPSTELIHRTAATAFATTSGRRGVASCGKEMSITASAARQVP
ncbi:unnamed protein product [Prorocentrum cordatum]|uniref:Cellulase n=1 Tax=Prorocentrum cordatum TaxID=2364126 RepID=A0ABN9QMI3_9DINO|nr:unnamed protein product [Polarella glacialis]